MANTKKNSQDVSTITTTTLSNTSPSAPPAKENGKLPIPTIVLNMNEQNNNTINTLPPSKQGILQCLPEMFTDIDLTNQTHLNGAYINDDLYKSYILGKFQHQFQNLIYSFIPSCGVDFMNDSVVEAVFILSWYFLSNEIAPK